jgi:hypothetical protein
MDPEIKRADDRSVFVIVGTDLVSIAACAPSPMTVEEVTVAVNAQYAARYGYWSADDRPDQGVQCKDDPDARRHWLMRRPTTLDYGQ